MHNYSFHLKALGAAIVVASAVVAAQQPAPPQPSLRPRLLMRHNKRHWKPGWPARMPRARKLREERRTYGAQAAPIRTRAACESWPLCR